MEMNLQSDFKNYLPLLCESSSTMTLAYYNGRVITQKEFLSHVNAVRRKLARHKYCINLCENRYHFLVAFAACASLGQICLLPASRSDSEISRLHASYENSYLLDESMIELLCSNKEKQQTTLASNFQIGRNQIVVIVFTSGSTGVPTENPKTWGQLVASAERIKHRFGFNCSQQHVLIATVPPQHMFGFETTIVYPLVSSVAIHAGRPFYPMDIQQAIADTPSPHILITTPLHLKVCSSEKTSWPSIDFIISATAPLPADTAETTEQVLNTRVFEIYGCSEAGAIATRRLCESSRWHLLENYRVAISNKNTVLEIPAYPQAIVIPDQLEVYDECYFKLAGRNSDVINIGGKRGSLADLSNKLKSITGISDAVFIMPDKQHGKRTRLVALIVTNNPDTKQLRLDLAKLIDAVFLPRPFIVVQQLPYNEIGKLPRAKLLELVKQHRGKNSE